MSQEKSLLPFVFSDLYIRLLIRENLVLTHAQNRQYFHVTLADVMALLFAVVAAAALVFLLLNAVKLWREFSAYKAAISAIPSPTNDALMIVGHLHKVR